MRNTKIVALGVVVFSICPSTSRGGDGVLALQSADASCPDDSGAIYVDCGNGTVTDNRTGLVWLANADCYGAVTWDQAIEIVAGLSDQSPGSAAASHDCGLSDGSSPGEWRLPSVAEWEAMIADAVALGCVSFGDPSITNDSGADCWQEGSGNSFSGVVSSHYWSSTTLSNSPTDAWAVVLDLGDVSSLNKSFNGFVWPVRGGQ